MDGMLAYTFETLSPYDFQVLVGDLLQAEWGIQLESFSPGPDGGVDLRYQGRRERWVVQCKHYPRASFATLRSKLKKEAKKVQRLSPTRYVIATSGALTPRNKDEIVAQFKPWCLGSHDVLSREDLNNLLRHHPEVERKHFKLWIASSTILDRILHAHSFNRSREEIEGIKHQLRLYVYNDSFQRALEVLQKHHLCVITGIPGIGKTFLAQVLLIHYLCDGYEAIVVDKDIQEAWSRVVPRKRQIFYYDDFLGQTALEDKLGKNEDRSLVKFVERVQRSNDKRFILTTREYILQQASSRYEKLGQLCVKAWQTVVNLSDYTRRIRAQILYNHLYFSRLPAGFCKSLVRGKKYWRIIKHPNFNPRIIEWMTDVIRLERIKPSEYVERFVASLQNPTDLWRHAFENQLSAQSRNLLLSLASLPDEPLLATLEHAFENYHRAITERFRLLQTPNDFKRALDEVDGTFIRSSPREGGLIIEFHNPSARDFVETRLQESREEYTLLWQSITYLDQCARLIGFLGKDRSQLGRLDLETVLAAIQRCTDMSDGKHKIGIVAGARILLVLEYASAAKVELGLVGEVVGSMLEKIYESVIDSQEIADADRENLLGLAELMPLELSARMPSWRKLTRALFQHLSQDFHFESDAQNLIRFMKACPDSYSAADLERTRDSFIDFARNYPYSVSIRPESPEAYRGMAEDLVGCARELGVPVFRIESAVEHFEGRAKALEERDKPENPSDPVHETGQWKLQATNDDTENAEIDALFRQLVE